MTYEQTESQGPVIRDKRRFDPVTGALREPQATAAPAEPSDSAADVAVDGRAGLDVDGAGEAGVGAPGDVDDSIESSPDAIPVRAGGPADSSEVEVALAERTADLQRLQAEYVNYKRRVDRDREVARDAAKISALTAMLPVLDDIGRAREHGELTGGFKAVAESLERIVTSLGLVPFGEVGDEFDPHRHEALMHSYSEAVSSPVCQAVLQVGYQFGERVVRPARVAVAEPIEASNAEPAAADETDSSVVESVPESSGAAGRGDQTS